MSFSPPANPASRAPRFRALPALAACLVLAMPGSAAAEGFSAADFLKTDGPVVRADQGRGKTVVLRGTNLGGWFVQEGWMSPNGHGELPRTEWTAAGPAAAAAIDGNPATGWRPAPNAEALLLHFGAWRAFDRIEIDFAGAPGVVAIAVSRDGEQWQPAKVRETRVADAHCTLELDNVYTGRHVRIVPAAGATAIAEVRLHQNDDYSVRVALRERFGVAQADALLDAYQETWITPADLDRIKGWNLNVVRVPLNWLEFMEPDGTEKPAGWRQLDRLIDECDRRRLYVILDLHAVPGGASPWASSGRAGDDGTGQNPNGFWTNPAFQDLTIRLWEKIAGRYRGRAAVAGYDLINEPLCRFDELPRPGERYAEAVLKKGGLFNRLYRAVRAVDPDHVIFIAAYTVAPPDNTAYIGTPSGFRAIPPPAHHGWTNVVYETHHYDMPNAHDRAAQERLVVEALADIARHQREWNVPVFAGEYSLYGFYDVWARWMTGLNALNVSWTNWTYKIRGTARDPAGADWGFFHTNRNPIPDVNRDSAGEIAAKWSRFGTAEFTRNERLIEVVSRCAKADGAGQ